MNIPVSKLDQFYQTPLGIWVRETLEKKIFVCWPEKREAFVLGVGYPLPYMPAFQEQSGRCSVFMFRQKELVSWPSGAQNIVVLGEEGVCPFSDNQFDKIFVIHSLEFSEEPLKFLREMWRILKPEGEIVLIVPNHYGLWTRKKQMPWGGQNPYFLSQVLKFLQKTCFVVLKKEKALFSPPFRSPLGLALAPFWEKMGDWGIGFFSAVWIIHVQKQVYQLAFPRKSIRRAPVILVEGGH